MALSYPRWDELTNAEEVTARTAGSAIFHPGSGRVIVFGGGPSGASIVNTTYSIDVDTDVGVLLSPAGSLPNARVYHSAIFDSVNNRMLVFGGQTGPVSFLNDLWSLSLDVGSETWTQLTPVGGPPSQRARAGMIYDSANHRIILFGGSGAAAHIGDLWELNLTTLTWSLLVAAGSVPSARYSFAMVYDSVNSRAIVFGGTDVGGDLQDLYSLDLSAGSEAWSTLSVSGAPGARREMSYCFDSNQSAMLIFGGWDVPVPFYSDAWALMIETVGGESWSEYSPLTTPGVRRLAATAFDSQNNRMIIHGGNAATSYEKDTWAFTPISPAPSISNIRPLGECEITYNSIDMGLSKGGCEIQIIDTIKKTVIDKYGSSPIKSWNQGVNINVKTNLMEHSWNILEQIFRSTGSRGLGPDRISWGSGVGEEVQGAELRLHPRNEPTGDYDVIVYAAVPELDSVIPFMIDTERIYPVKWMAVIDDSRADGDMLFRIGNLS
tara:strand:- start:7 stop:1485 length:1479 start_codon:yes stop_codon:yes gene_type:complete